MSEIYESIGSMLPLMIVDNIGNIVETTICDSISGANGIDGMPKQLSLIKFYNGKVTRAEYVYVPTPEQNKCQECAIEHDPKDPHNKHSLFYQFKFNIEYNRQATWEDAMAHCDEETKNLWRKELQKRGIDPNL